MLLKNKDIYKTKFWLIWITQVLDNNDIHLLQLYCNSRSWHFTMYWSRYVSPLFDEVYKQLDAYHFVLILNIQKV